jgi:F0F1-type ATP synthase epsilon subunit
MSDNLKLQVLIRTKNKTLFEGEVFSVSGVNDTGPFDILPMHANFVTLIKGKIILDKGLPTKNELSIDRGVLTVSENKVSGFIGI